jgi:superfamily I DNA/RNA helicase/RecB family exonuclease
VVAGILEDEDPGDWPIIYQGILSTPAFAAETADFVMRCSERLLSPDDLAARAAERADWRGLPGLYERYLERLREIDRTDYGVLLVSAVKLLRSDEGQRLAAQFRYVLVDEYQDTSPVQAEIAALLTHSGGNLTVTGDPYQSIYSFRGAELRNIAGFTVTHPESTRYVLSQSFRVPETILRSALRVVSSGELPGAAGPVEPACHEGRSEAFIFDQETAEAEWIAQEVEHMIRVDGIRKSSIAVLTRSKRELISELSRALSRRDIPHDPPDSRLVDHPAVGLFHDLVTVALLDDYASGSSPVMAADGDRAMRRILLGPLVGLSLGKERSLLRERRRTRSPWPQILRREAPEWQGLADLLTHADWATDQKAVDGFWHAWTNLDGIDELVADPARMEWRRAWSAFAQVLSRQAERDPDLSLARFFQLTEEEDFEATPLLSHRLTDDRVTLTTLHQAKGLEFDVVFIANAVEGVFPDLRRSRRMLRPELLSPERTVDPSAQHLFQLQEEMRLAYTAITRARLRVVWTATDAGVDQGEHRPSRFLVAASGVSTVAEIGTPPETARDPVTLSEAETALRRDLLDPTASAARRLTAASVLGQPDEPWWEPASFPGVPESGPDSPILGETIHLSPSQADSYKRCPRQYALERRLRLGNASSPYAHFGSLVHKALEKAERSVIGTNQRHGEVSHTIECLETVWTDADFGTPELNAAWLGKATDVIVKLYDRWPNPDGVPIDLEKRVEAIIEGVKWIGVIDRVESTSGGTLRVVDYKTSTQAMSVKDAAESIQLGFYAMALMAEGGDVTEAQLWYPRTGAKSVSTRSLDMNGLEDVQDEMKRVTVAIRSEDWEPLVGAPCERCAFRMSCPAWPQGSGAYLP